MSLSAGLTRELYEPDISPADARRHLEDAQDISVTYKAADMFGNDNPRPPRKFRYDRRLRGTGTLAWYLDPQDVKKAYPMEGMMLEQEIGPDPIVAYNPDIVNEPDRKYKMAIDAHEKAHGGQQGKMQLKQLYAKTGKGAIPLGLMLIEGGVEWALERRGIRPPTRYMDERSRRKPVYSIFRDFVYELEEKQHGIMRQVYRAADRAGPRAAARLLENVPGIGRLVEKYASKLSMTYQRPALRLAA